MPEHQFSNDEGICIWGCGATRATAAAGETCFMRPGEGPPRPRPPSVVDDDVTARIAEIRKEEGRAVEPPAFWANLGGVPAAMRCVCAACLLLLGGCAAQGSLQTAGNTVTGVAQYPVTEAGAVIGNCISTLATIKQQLNGSPAVP